jgi:hypothetical protein
MRETPESFRASGNSAPADDLSGFRWNTGATLRPIAPDEPCHILFRDIGPAALALFLRGKLPRLAGPLSPIVYMRTAEYEEPYTDYEQTGRLVILRPLALGPWHSGQPHIFVSRARMGVDFGTVGFVPGEVPLTKAARLVGDAADTRELRDALGGRAHGEAVAESLHRLDRLAGELAATEEFAEPLRKRLYSPDRDTRERAKDAMARAGLTEGDLCTAWHHIPRDRRAWIAEALRGMKTPPQPLPQGERG